MNERGDVNMATKEQINMCVDLLMDKLESFIILDDALDYFVGYLSLTRDELQAFRDYIFYHGEINRGGIVDDDDYQKYRKPVEEITEKILKDDPWILQELSEEDDV